MAIEQTTLVVTHPIDTGKADCDVGDQRHAGDRRDAAWRRAAGAVARAARIEQAQPAGDPAATVS